MVVFWVCDGADCQGYYDVHRSATAVAPSHPRTPSRASLWVMPGCSAITGCGTNPRCALRVDCAQGVESPHVHSHPEYYSHGTDGATSSGATPLLVDTSTEHLETDCSTATLQVQGTPGDSGSSYSRLSCSGWCHHSL